MSPKNGNRGSSGKSDLAQPHPDSHLPCVLETQRSCIYLAELPEPATQAFVHLSIKASYWEFFKLILFKNSLQGKEKNHDSSP